MTLTIEEIKGMKIPVGTPIEIIGQNRMGEEKTIGYFEGILPGRNGILLYQTCKGNNREHQDETGRGCHIDKIEEIKLLKYQK